MQQRSSAPDRLCSIVNQTRAQLAQLILKAQIKFLMTNIRKRYGPEGKKEQLEADISRRVQNSAPKLGL